MLVYHSTDSSKGSTESSKGSTESSVNGGKLCSPLTADQALRLYRSQLTTLEQAEIHSYPDIYFVGPNAKKRPAVAGGNNNCGYDDEQGSYIHVPHDHLAYRYEFLKVRRRVEGILQWQLSLCKTNNVVSEIFSWLSFFICLFFALFRSLVRVALARWPRYMTINCSSTWLWKWCAMRSASTGRRRRKSASWNISVSRIVTAPWTLCTCLKTSPSATTSAWLLSCWAWTCMSSSNATSSRGSAYHWSGSLHTPFCSAWRPWADTESSTVTSSQKTSCSNSRVVVASRWGTWHINWCWYGFVHLMLMFTHEILCCPVFARWLTLVPAVLNTSACTPTSSLASIGLQKWFLVHVTAFLLICGALVAY